MATEAHEILNLIRLASSRPPSPSPSTSGAHSNTLPSAPPEPTTTSVRAKTTDYITPLKGASRANTIPSTSASSQTHTDVIREIRTSSTFIQQKLHEVDLKLININKSIHNHKRNTCSFCSTFKVVLLLIILGIIVYYIFFKTD